MRKIFDSYSGQDSSIAKIVPKKDGYYKVFFNFLHIPVEMNEDYLKTIIKENEFDHSLLNTV